MQIASSAFHEIAETKIDLKMSDKTKNTLDDFVESKQKNSNDLDSLKEEIESTVSELISDSLDSTIKDFFNIPEIMNLLEPDGLVNSIIGSYNEFIELKQDSLYKMLLNHFLFKSLYAEGFILLDEVLKGISELKDGFSDNSSE